MELSIIEYKDGEFKADLLDIPGNPPVGYGKSKEEAVARLMQILLNDYGCTYINISEDISITYK